MVPVHQSACHEDYHGLREMYRRDLYAKAVTLDGDLYLEVIKLQEELKFHFYYTGVDPEDGTDEPTEWMCLVIYDRRNLPDITSGRWEAQTTTPQDPRVTSSSCINVVSWFLWSWKGR